MHRKKLTEEEKKGSLTVHINENLLEKIDKLNENGNRSDFIEKNIIRIFKR
jgi:metal-responsive CopG/Arc/MetJ family transcriptional regulator